MEKEQQMVREFHEKAGAVINAEPTVIDSPTRLLRLDLINEEWKELVEAMGYTNIEGCPINMTDVDEPPYDHVAVADAIGDLLYVVLGTAISCGIDITQIFHEIHRSNMTKFIDGQRRPDGKWLKGPSYTPPNISRLIKIQSCQHEFVEVWQQGTTKPVAVCNKCEITVAIPEAEKFV